MTMIDEDVVELFLAKRNRVRKEPTARVKEKDKEKAGDHCRLRLFRTTNRRFHSFAHPWMAK